ncbi:beta-N-acetylhexosaminidase [Runella sp.]|uniref:beta-N-acetylhexosaminidase n=1 Tax=Runella sp. TaxID=1960881 RepID=UPI002629FCC3|nr:beta-N-acetylhexosaminidase [Runella sp.]
MKNSNFFLYLIIVVICSLNYSFAKGINIIPWPTKVEIGKGDFILNKNTLVCYNHRELNSLSEYLSKGLQLAIGSSYKLEQINRNAPLSKAINLIVNPSMSIGNKEGYELTVTEKQIIIKSIDQKGIFYGIQSLLQLLPITGSMKIPCVNIIDEPRFAWRGIMIDVSRHFYTLNQLRNVIDYMGIYKLNTLQLHLTDDHGWRLEIKKRPKLTTIGAWRVPRTGLWAKRDCPEKGEVASDGGFYTQNEMRELIKYANSRNVTILPEIDFPGHSLAAIASYSELSCSGDSQFVSPGCPIGGIRENILCAGKESTFAFVEDVLSEVAMLFPNKYVHIGGDEAFYKWWEKCDKCKARMRENGLNDAHALQSYFTKRVSDILKKHGKMLIGWDEIMKGGLPPNAAITSWTGIEPGIEASKKGHYVVMNPTRETYFDFRQGDPAIEPPAATYGKCILLLKDVYKFNPLPEGCDPKFILGGQGSIWTEEISTYPYLEYMLLPRALALSEVLWSSSQLKNWEGFTHRLERHLDYFLKNDIVYSRSHYDATIVPSKGSKGNLLIDVETQIKGLDVYYSFENFYPDHHCKKYIAGEHISIPKDAETFRVITYRNGKPVGRIISVSLDELQTRINQK